MRRVRIGIIGSGSLVEGAILPALSSAAMSVAAAFATYYVFENYLQILLPRGSWTGF